MRNWFGNQGRTDRFPQKVLITGDDVDEDGKVIHRRKQRTKSTKKSKTTPLPLKEQVIDLLGTRRRKCPSYEVYRGMNWQLGLKERVDTHWEMFKPLLSEGTDLTVAHAEFDKRFSAMELANQTLEIKRQLSNVCGDVKAEVGAEGASSEEHEHIQELVELAEYVPFVLVSFVADKADQSNQQRLGATMQHFVDAVHSKTGMSFIVIGGGCDINKNGGLTQYT